MSEPTREASAGSRSESSASSPNPSCATESSNGNTRAVDGNGSNSSSTRSGSSSSGSGDGNGSSTSSSCSSSSSISTATGGSQVTRSCSNSNLTNGSNWRPTCAAHDNTREARARLAIETEESTTNILKDPCDEATHSTRLERAIATSDTPFGDSLPDGSNLKPCSSRSGERLVRDSGSPNLLLAAAQSTSDSFSDMHYVMRRATLRTLPSTSPTVIDTNNNRNSSSSTTNETSNLRRNNFSKSASGSRLTNRSDTRVKVCDCMSQNCSEKEHSNRRRFIESYYNNRTRLPSANALSTSNISTPLNQLSECDEITKRLLSSPIRTVNLSERSSRRTHIGEVEKSRRASLGTNAIPEQVTLFLSSQFTSIELGNEQNSSCIAREHDHHCHCYHQHHHCHHQHHCHNQNHQQEACLSRTEGNQLSAHGDGKLKKYHMSHQQQLHQQQQQQGRSLSVCQDDTSKPQFRINSSNHSVNLNRAVSLACESSSSRQLLTIIPLFGCDMKALEQLSKLGWVLPPPIDSAVDYILAHGINAIGIFRKSGVKSRILTLKKRIEANQAICLDEIVRDNEFSIYDIADLVKMWFRELKPTPLMTKDLIKLISNTLQEYGQAHTCTSQQTRGKPIDEDLRTIEELGAVLKKQLNAMTSPIHRALFSKAITFFAAISSNGDINQMTSQNLAICLTPSLCATEPDQASILIAQGALRYCIDNHQILF